MNNYNKYFFKNRLTDEQLSLLHKVIDIGGNFISGDIRDSLVIKYENTKMLKDIASLDLPKDASDLNTILDDLNLVGRYSISQSDTKYFAFPDSANSIPGLAADIYSKFINQNLIAVDRSAPILTFIEIQLIEWIRELIGYDYKKLNELNNLSEIGGLITTGGHMSNHIAILTALNSRFPEVRNVGISGLPIKPKIVIAGKIAHYSHIAAIHHLGLGQDNVINVDTNSDYQTDPISLEQILNQHQKLNDILMVIIVAGNAKNCKIDNIRKISEICKKYNVWLHVDACHGGAYILSEKLKAKYLDGIDSVDSISIDPHKGLFVTYPCSAILIKQRGGFNVFCRYPDSLNNSEIWDLGLITPFFGSRGGDSLKLWQMIKTTGLLALSEAVEKRYEMSQLIYQKLNDNSDIYVFGEMDIYRTAFLFIPIEIQNLLLKANRNIQANSKYISIIEKYNHQINEELYQSGLLTLDEFKFNDMNDKFRLGLSSNKILVMSIAIGDPTITEQDINANLEVLWMKFEKYRQLFIADFFDIDNLALRESQTSGPAGW